MANFEKLLDTVLESSVYDDQDVIVEVSDKVKEIKKNIKTAKKNKDIELMEKISVDIDEAIKIIDNYRQHEVNIDNYPSIDKTIKTLKVISSLFTTLAVAIPVAYLTKTTLDGIKAWKMGTLATKEDMINLKSYSKDPNFNKFVNGASFISGVTASASNEIANKDRRKIVGSYEYVMKTLKDDIDKLSKLNKKLKADIEKTKKKANNNDTSVKESVDDIKLEIYESCHAGDITEEERDELLSMLYAENVDSSVSDINVCESAKDVLPAIGSVIVAVGGLSAIAISIGKKIKINNTIDSNEDLSKISKDINTCLADIEFAYDKLRPRIQKYEKLKDECNGFAELFGKKTREVFDGYEIYDEGIVNKYRTELNPHYDPKKAEEWKKASEEARECEGELRKLRSEISSNLSKINIYSKRLKNIAKKYSKISPEAVSELDKSVGEVLKAIDDVHEEIKKFDEKMGKNVKESVDEIKLEIYESCYTGDITEEERDELLSML